ncbi:MAG: hypothetical protein ACM3SW_20315 [Actinomycetota bacterium]
METSTPGGAFCKACRQSVTRSFYRYGNEILCGRCADRLKREVPQDSHASFVRAMVGGLVGFAIGLALYAGFVIATGISIGYVALVVGFLVGKAMMIGSGGVGGRRYQIAALLFTYAAVSMASIPITIHYMRKQSPPAPAAQQKIASQDDSVAGTSQSAPPATNNGTRPVRKMSLGSVVGVLALIGLASPFLELSAGPSGFIGLIILFVGLRFAWKMTAGRGNTKIEGPFQLSNATPA